MKMTNQQKEKVEELQSWLLNELSLIRQQRFDIIKRYGEKKAALIKKKLLG